MFYADKCTSCGRCKNITAEDKAFVCFNKAKEICGFTFSDNLEPIAEYADLFLFDYKETNYVMHKKFTEVGNEIITSNLKLLNSLKKQIILRCTIISGYNDRKEHFDGICDIANGILSTLKLNRIIHSEKTNIHHWAEQHIKSRYRLRSKNQLGLMQFQKIVAKISIYIIPFSVSNYIFPL